MTEISKILTVQRFNIQISYLVKQKIVKYILIRLLLFYFRKSIFIK